MSETDELVARLVAERDVLATLHRYAHAIDYGNHTGWADCFTPDGVFEIRVRRGGGFEPWARYEGAVELEAFVRTHSHAPDAWHKHLLMDSVVEVSGGEASVASFFARIDAGDSGPYLRAFGRYTDRLVPSRDGRWRIRHRLAEIEGMAPGASPHRARARATSNKK